MSRWHPVAPAWSGSGSIIIALRLENSFSPQPTTTLSDSGCSALKLAKACRLTGWQCSGSLPGGRGHPWRRQCTRENCVNIDSADRIDS
jgi:hypothetical protein